MTGPQVPPRARSTINNHIPVRKISDRRSKQRQNGVKDRRAKVEPYSFSPLYAPSSDCPFQSHVKYADPSKMIVMPQTTATPPAKASDVLQSWKEIAAYIKRSVRTCQRWESEAELPVHRPRPTPRSPVFSFPAELELWMKQQRVRIPTENPSPALRGVAVKHAVA